LFAVNFHDERLVTCDSLNVSILLNHVALELGLTKQAYVPCSTSQGSGVIDLPLKQQKLLVQSAGSGNTATEEAPKKLFKKKFNPLHNLHSPFKENRHCTQK
jgi:hypothetical protein